MIKFQAGPFLGDGRGLPLALWMHDTIIKNVKKIDGYTLDSNYDDFGEQFEFYSFEITAERMQQVLEGAQDDLNDLKKEGDTYTDDEGDEETYDEQIEILNEEEAVNQYLEQTKETLDSLLVHPLKWLREAAIKMKRVV